LPDPACHEEEPSLIHLARHGHVENPSGVLYGNLPGFLLSHLGRQQAAALGRRLTRLPLKAIYSSPLERAVETACIATARRPATVDELVDWEPVPDWVGLPWSEIPARDPSLWREFRHRPWIDAEPATRALRRIAAAHPGSHVVVVGHQDPLRAVINTLHGAPGVRLRDDPFPQGALRTLDPRTWRVVAAWDPPGASDWPAGTMQP
jgi:probable phosphoglycerate mutase